ncbi:ATP-binding protein [Faecalitalea cylindroides]|uniref:ATP-binding protein n=1 Tax=Faecalitalea cylindroides TaxID=39483 RepID=UPI000B39469C|nr:ATP-binding protein [Faecalitalea cylindroides]OUN59288.1 AAA family ATPase [Faecalitalea cylindroides]
MKKKNVINLIKYYSEKNDVSFKNEAYEIAKDFDNSGDYQLAEYIMVLLTETNTFFPQMDSDDLNFFEKIDSSDNMLLLPDEITNELLGIVNAIERNIGINKFMFIGAPGTGKTEAVKHLSRILKRDVYMVDFASVIDSKLGQTQKNITSLFKEINSLNRPNQVIILFDEIDAIALDRTNQNDLREMGRATTSILKGLESINDNIVLIATTNLYEHFDKALIRRFDRVVNFNNYSENDLMQIAEKLLDSYLTKLKLRNKDIRLFRKIMKLAPLPYPGDLQNLIKTSVAFSDPNDETDYFRRLYYSVTGEKPSDLRKLQSQKFTIREIEILTKISKSSVARELKGDHLDE